MHICTHPEVCAHLQTYAPEELTLSETHAFLHSIHFRIFAIANLVHTRYLEQKPQIDEMVTLICDWLGCVQRHCTLGQSYSGSAI